MEHWFRWLREPGDDYTQIIRFIKEKKPYIHTTLENTTPENAVQAKAYIQKLYDTCQIK